MAVETRYSASLLLAFFFFIIMVPIGLMASDVVIRIKVSAPKQTILMKTDFPKHTYGVGGQLLFHVQLSKDAACDVTNIRIEEIYNFDEASKHEIKYEVIDTGIPEIFIVRCQQKLILAGIHEYRIRLSGRDSDGMSFLRNENRQIIVEDALDGSFVFTSEIGPFIINSDDTIMFGGKEISLESFLKKPPLDRQMKDLFTLPQKYKLLIEGYADQSTKGDISWNFTLSSNRARKVKSLISKIYGIPVNRIDVKGLGTDNIKYMDAPGTVINRNRRAQVIFPANMPSEDD
jgi:outer membrane protein OmpA-like peptidoglycan-associated protein